VLVKPPETPVKALTDRLQLQRILEHLVGNALAYTRGGAPAAVSIHVTALEHRRQARLLVEDQGRGMSQGSSERIFERFQRIEDPDQPAVPGTGLGLYIARELAERHGGSLELEWTQPGQGSRFALHLPLAADQG
jgi:signal transduction histidine kinase